MSKREMDRTPEGPIGVYSLRLLQTIEPVAHRRRHRHDLRRAIVIRCRQHLRPIGCVQVGVLLQRPAGRGRRPGDDDTVRGRPHDGQPRRTGHLNGGNDATEAALERVIAAAQGAGIGLTNGAADGIDPASAGAAAVNGVPIYRVLPPGPKAE